MIGVSGLIDGPRISTKSSIIGAQFINPLGLAIDSNNDLFVADANTIRQIVYKTKLVYTIAGHQNSIGYQDGLGCVATFSLNVTNLAITADRYGLFITDKDNNEIREITIQQTSYAGCPTPNPTSIPIPEPTFYPTKNPRANPTKEPTKAPRNNPTHNPARHHSARPTHAPRTPPTVPPTRIPRFPPTHLPHDSP